MFNLSKLKLVSRAYVGLTTDGNLSIPKGSDVPQESSPELALEWLGKLLKLLLLHQLHTTNGNKAGREGVAEPDSAQTAMQGEGCNAFDAQQDELNDKLPSHFGLWYAVIAKLLERANDPVVFAVRRRIIRSEEILYSQLHRHLQHAFFVDDDVIMLEHMPRTGMRGRFEASDMIGLLCWLALDVTEKLHLDIEFPKNVRGLAEDFSDRHLRHEASLFGEDSQGTLDDLRTTFEELRRYHPPVDADTEDIIEVIENYLYAGKISDSPLKIATESKNGEFGAGESVENVLFGSQFFDIWEMLCLHHAFRNDIEKSGWQVLIADGGNVPRWFSELDKNPFNNKLANFNATSKKTVYDNSDLANFFKQKRPDLILYKEENGTVKYRVVDFKYYSVEYKKIENKRYAESPELTFNDASKSFGYAQSVLNLHNEKKIGQKLSIEMEFWLPSDKANECDAYFDGHAKPIAIRITRMIDSFLAASACQNIW